MNPTVEKALEKGIEGAETVIKNGVEAIQAGTNFMLEQIPIVLQEFLTWRFYECLISGIISLIIVPLTIYYGKKFLCWMWKDNKNSIDGLEPLFAIVLLAIVVISGIGVCKVIDNAKDCVQIKVAPRVYLIEEALNFYNSKTQQEKCK
jgi:hypothetical protein